MGKKIYVGNLPYSTNEQLLKTQFESFGVVHSSKIITDRATGRSKGFGFIEMNSAEEASLAIEKLNGSVFNGRPMTVTLAKPVEPKKQMTHMA